VTQGAIWVLAFAMPVGGVLLARRNLRLGRGDRKGAFRVALYVFAMYSLARLFRADHVSVAREEVWILIKVFAYPCFWALQVWLLYIALEPLARRQWPQMLIAWKRLLSGRTRDPLVGREVLVGAAAGTAASLLHSLSFFSSPPHSYRLPWATSSLREALFTPFVDAYSAVLYGMSFLFVLVLLRAFLRNRWLALGVWCLVLSGPVETEPWTLAVLRAVIWALVLTRGGLLSFASALFFFFAVNEAPFLLDRSAWYVPNIALILVFLWALMLYAFHTSLAGKSILGRALED
jgi:hypothetical protein